MGTQATFQIYEDEFQSGVTEVMMQNANAFNEASLNAIQLVPSLHRGNFAKEAFFKEIAGLIKHRDPLSTSPAAAQDLAQGELIMPKINRFYKVAKTRDAFKKIFPGSDAMAEFSVVLGRQVGEAMLQDYLNTGLYALRGALESNAQVQENVTSANPNTLSYESLTSGTWRFGDKAQDIVAYVLHSKQARDLNVAALAKAYDRVGGAAIYEGDFGTLGRRLIVTDSPALVKTGGSPVTTTYYGIGLTAGGLAILESETSDNVPYMDVDTAGQNLRYVIMGEHAYNVRVKGYSYTDSDISPENSDLVDDSNWGKVSTDNKSTAGVLFVTR